MISHKTGHLIKNTELATKYKNGIPGKDWVAGFRHRHPDIVWRATQGIEASRVEYLTIKNTNEMFDMLEAVFENADLNNHPEYG